MTSVGDDIATKLQRWLADRHGLTAPIVRAAPPSGPAIVVAVRQVANSSIRYESLDLVNAPLSVKLDISVDHQVGDANDWNVTISGADAADREALYELFHPQQLRTHHMQLNDHTYASFAFAGAVTTYPR